MPRLSTLIFLGLFMIAAPAAAAGDEGDIRGLLSAQAAAWNAGDLEAFMAGYWHSEELRFASGGSVTFGWDETLESYRRRYDSRAKMGTLAFSGIDVRQLSDDYALAFGHWALDRGEGDLEGVFTLILEKRPEGWRIIHDHSSEAMLPYMVIAE